MAVSNAESNALCRACMAPLGTDKFDILQIPDFAELYTQLSSTYVDSSDSLPKSICTACYALIKDFDRFQSMCAESYKLLLVKFTQVIVPKVEKEPDDVKQENMDPLETMECKSDEENFCDDDDNDANYDPLNDDDYDDEDEEEFKIDICDHPPSVVAVKEETATLQAKEEEEEEVPVKAPRSRRTTRQVAKENHGVETCDKCPKMFYKKDGHMRVHSGLKKNMFNLNVITLNVGEGGRTQQQQIENEKKNRQAHYRTLHRRRQRQNKIQRNRSERNRMQNEKNSSANTTSERNPMQIEKNSSANTTSEKKNCQAHYRTLHRRQQRRNRIERNRSERNRMQNENGWSRD